MLPPPRAGGVPILGVLPRVTTDPLGTFTAAAALGPLVHLGTTWDPVVGRSPCLLVSDPALIEPVLLDLRTFDKDYRVLGPIMGDGIFTSSGDTWRVDRRALTPAFSRAAHDGFLAAMRAAVHDRLSTWSPGDTLHLAREMSTLTLDVVLRALFGTVAADLEADVHRGLREAIPILDQRVWLPSFPDWLPTPTNRRLGRAIALLDACVERILQLPPADPPNLLSLLRAAWPDADDPAHRRKQRDQLLTFVLAGHETTAAALTWTLWMLANHPDLEEQVRQELTTRAGDTPDDLPFLHATTQEALRLHPPVWAFARTVLQPTTLGDHPLSPGDVLFVCPWQLHRQPLHHPDPLRPDPGRHLRPPTWHPSAFLPFGGGPRTCLGNRFAILELAVLLSGLLRRFRFTFLGSLRELPRLTLYPDGDLRVRLTAP